MKFPTSLMLAGASLLALTTGANAQTQPADQPPAAEADASDGGDIIVTARRSEERLQDVPISITVFNQQQLNNRNVTNAQDLATFTPSLSATTGFGSENSTFALRGFVQETGTAPSVGVYFADVVAPRGASQGFPAGDGAGPGNFFDLQNVQVLKGPQGTLFGRNTTGGAVLLVPQRPTDKLEGYLEGSLGNYNMYRVQGVLNVPLTDTLKVRVGVDHQKRDGYMHNTTGIGPKDFENVNYVTVRGSVVWNITPNLENYTVANWTDSKNNGHTAKLIACDSNPSLVNLLGLLGCAQIAKRTSNNFYNLENDMPDPTSRLRQWQAINTTTWKFSDAVTAKNIISYAKLRTIARNDLFGTAFVIPKGFLFAGLPAAGIPPYPDVDTPTSFATVRNITGGYTSNETTFTEEFRLQGKAVDNRLNWQAGIYYENATPNGFIGNQSPVFIGCSDPDNFVCTDLTGGGGVHYTIAQNSSQTKGLYAQASFALTDQFSFTGGFRYTWDKARSLSRAIVYTFPLGVVNAMRVLPVVNFGNAGSHCEDPARTAPLCELDETAKSHAPTWLIDFDYKPSTDTLIYAKYARGYRTGGVKSDVPIEFHFFRPEKVDTVETGLKTSFRGALRGYFNVAAFYNWFSNQQIQFGFNDNPAVATQVSPTAGPINVGKSRIYGLETDAHFNLFKGFTLDAAYAYLHTRVSSVVTPTLPATSPYVPSGFVKVGDPLVLTPKHKLTATATYTLPLDDSIGQISIGATYSLSSKQIANYTDRTATALTGGVDLGLLPSRNLVNLNLNWNGVGGTPIDLSLFATNVFKEKYYTFVSGVITSAGVEAASIGEPRMFGARLRYRFGS